VTRHVLCCLRGNRLDLVGHEKLRLVVGAQDAWRGGGARVGALDEVFAHPEEEKEAFWRAELVHTCVRPGDLALLFL